MWKLIGILALIIQLSIHAAVIEPVNEVALKSDDNYIVEDREFFKCYLTEVKSSKDQVKVTSTTLEMDKLKSLNNRIFILISGNKNYPEYFPKDLGTFVDGITGIKYEATPLKYITRDDFKGMASKLYSINLQNNQIEEIPFDTFYDLPKLAFLNVRDNKIKSLPPNLFTNSPVFISLVIISNKLTALHADLFKDCPAFEILRAEFNQIEELHEDLFKNNPNMTIISMKHNKIRNIPMDFNRFELLGVADFTHNGGTCDTMYFSFKPFVETYDEEEQKKLIKTVPEFQQKIEEVCRQ